MRAMSPISSSSASSSSGSSNPGAAVRQWRGPSRSSGGRRESPREALRAWLAEGGPLALGVVLFLFLAHLAYGANNDRLSMLFTALVGAGLAGLFFASAKARRALSAVDWRVGAACGLFAASFAVGLLGLTPWLPGGAHPVWSYVPAAAPAVTLSRSDTVLALIRLAGVGCAFLIGLVLARRDEFVARLFSTLLVVFSLFALWALWGFLSDPEGLFGYRRELPTTRLMAAFGSPNSAALLFAIGLLLSVEDILRTLRRYEGFKGVIRRSERALPRLAPGVVCFLLCAADLTLTQSRVGAVAVLTALVVLGASETLRSKTATVQKGNSLLVASVAVAFMFLALVAYRPELIARLMSAGADLETRESIFGAHWRAIQASPWFGYGLGTFDAVNKLMTTPENYLTNWNIRALHDVYLEWIEGIGFVGAAPMFAAVIFANVAVAQGAFRRERMAGWRRAILCISLVVAAMGLTDYGLEEPSIALTWSLLLGVGAGLGRR
jgi:O-antigen ligase